MARHPDPNSNQTHELLTGLDAGNADAVGPLASELHNQIVQAVRSKKKGGLRQCVDTEDLVQDVWATVLSRIDQLPTFSSREDVMKYLMRVAGRQVTKQRRKHFADKRDVRRNVSFEEHTHAPNQTATPSKELMANERSGLTAVESQVLDLRLRGHSRTEIAEMLDTNESKIRRILRSIARKQAEPYDNETTAGP